MAGSDGAPRGDQLAERVAVLEERMMDAETATSELQESRKFHAARFVKWAIRIKRLERDRVEPAHPGGIGGEWRWKDNALPADKKGREPCGLVEQRQHPYRVGPDLSPDAEPPGSPTVEEVDGRPIDLTPEQQKRIADQWRRECWEIRFAEGGGIWGWRSHEDDADVIIGYQKKYEHLNLTKHRMVELLDGEEIVRKGERDQLQTRVAELEKRNTSLCDDVNDAIQKRVAAETKYRERRDAVREKAEDLLHEVTDD